VAGLSAGSRHGRGVEDRHPNAPKLRDERSWEGQNAMLVLEVPARGKEALPMHYRVHNDQVVSSICAWALQVTKYGVTGTRGDSSNWRSKMMGERNEGVRRWIKKDNAEMGRGEVG
jgi:hypothetical protein